MENFTITINSSVVREEVLGGKKYFVTNLTAIKEGVWEGNKGKLYYPQEQIATNVSAWNKLPLTWNHPVVNGTAVSAKGSTEVAKEWSIGFTDNAAVKPELQIEGWIEQKALKKRDLGLYQKMKRRQPFQLEVSTGLKTENVDGPGVWNSKSYDNVAKNYVPDHLAILSNGKVGACSCNDGCGMVKNEADMTKEEKIALYEGIQNAKAAVGADMMFAGDLSHSDIHNSLNNALKSEHQTMAGGDYPGYYPGWIEDVYDGFFTYQQGGKTYKRDYSVKRDKGNGLPTAQLKGTKEEVRQYKEYRTMDNKSIALKDVHTRNEGTTMANESTATPPVQTPVVAAQAAVAPTTNAAPAAPSFEEWMKSAPPQFQEVVTNSLAIHNAEVDRLVAVITANAKNRFSKEFLKTKKLGELQAIAELAGPSAATLPNGDSVQNVAPPPSVTANALPPNYIGAAGAPSQIMQGPTINSKQVALPLPKIDVPTINVQEMGFSKR